MRAPDYGPATFGKLGWQYEEMTAEQMRERPGREMDQPASPGPGPVEPTEAASAQPAAAAAQETRPEPHPQHRSGTCG